MVSHRACTTSCSTPDLVVASVKADSFKMTVTNSRTCSGSLLYQAGLVAGSEGPPLARQLAQARPVPLLHTTQLLHHLHSLMTQ